MGLSIRLGWAVELDCRITVGVHAYYTTNYSIPSSSVDYLT